MTKIFHIQSKKRRRAAFSALGGLAIGTVLSLLILFIRPVAGIREGMNDQIYPGDPAGGANSSVVVVAIDERTLEEIGLRVFDWPRRLHTQAIDNLAAAGARVIVLDVLFAEESADDEGLVRAMAEAGNVILPLAGVVEQDGVELTGTFLLPPAEAGEFIFNDFVRSNEKFIEVALGEAHANQPIGPGNKIRHIPLTVVDSAGNRFPAMAVAGAMAQLGQSPKSPLTVANGEIKVPPVGFSREVPVNDVRQMRINYVGGVGAIPRISYIDAINGTIPDGAVEGKLVFVGLTATAVGDTKSTPLSEEMPGVEVHANAADTILRSRFLPDPEPMTTFVTMLLFTIIVSLTVPFLPLLWSSLLGVLLVVGYVFVAAFLTQTGTLLEIFYPVVLVVLMAVTMMVYRNVAKGAERSHLTGLFGTYVGKGPVAEAILAQSDTGALGLGGERASLSLLFTDIRGFSTFSEQMDPHALVDFLNEYLTEMTDLVFDEEGVLDKYIGDAVMAFWGWPLKQDDHAARAMKTSIRMVEKLAVMSEDFQKRGLPGLGIRTGVNSGDAAVGNMGSKSRFSITAMGDNVNLAARLEPINNQYGIDQMISGATLEMADGERDEFLTRPIDLVAVKGRSTGTAIHELIGFNDGSKFTDHLAPWAEAIDLYRNMKFKEAIMAFEKVQRIMPDDGTTKLYLERCGVMAEDPPEGDWDGVFVMKSRG